ncbi:SRPBCC family protein [Novosphingobium sp. Gsoil 351]|uniref:SRPBCC family protein n=1 Tax=Novosphingobium sp. Gsoil 351 TaxID=2675225 RepID=UPI0012B4983A|nr:SRPBCC family protein [Novosphingobium sp. Gsoil 351]QGN55187.1 ATPase [Novosphingobium sp. Gsoil 351]
MDLKFTVFAIVSRPAAEVFDAVADPAKLSAYFTTGGAVGRLEAGKTVQWDFADFPGAFPVDVVEAVPNERIVLRWGRNEDRKPTGETNPVTFTFTPLDGDTRTKVEIAESGWSETQAGLDASYGNCMGWSQMLSALKAWVEHGVVLREGMYK